MSQNNDAPDDFEDSLESRRLTLVEHLDELRNRIIKCLIMLAFTTGVCFGISNELINFLIKPCLPVIKQTYFTSLMQPFNICLKAAFLGGAVFSSPYLIYQVWGFIFPALTDKEKNVVRAIFMAALVFFFVGMALAYYLIIPMGAKVLIGYKTDAMIPLIGIEETINFVVFFLIAMGLVFETPLVMMGLAKAGIVNTRILSKNRKFAVLGSIILACVVTPGSEVLTSAILSVPLYLLFELSLIMMRFVEPKRTKEDILREKQEELELEAYDDDDDE